MQFDRDLSKKSPSSRRAWIEITPEPISPNPSMVSPSSRRAWIEIVCHFYTPFLYFVALLAEGVDRNPLYDQR